MQMVVCVFCPLQFSLQWPKIDPQQKGMFAGHSVWLLHNCKVTQGCRIHIPSTAKINQIKDFGFKAMLCI